MYQSERDIILQNYQNARKTYAQYGVDTDLAIKEFRSIPIAIHNWSDDDVSGFEKNGNVPSENTVTGNYPGKARNGDEIRQDLEQAIRLSPCFHKLNLQSFYAEPSQPKERNTYDTEDYRTWIDWAKKHHMGIDFNVSYFTSPHMKDGCSLASPDAETRKYWIQAGIQSRRIAEDIGKELDVPHAVEPIETQVVVFAVAADEIVEIAFADERIGADLIRLFPARRLLFVGIKREV